MQDDRDGQRNRVGPKCTEVYKRKIVKVSNAARILSKVRWKANWIWGKDSCERNFSLVAGMQMVVK